MNILRSILGYLASVACAFCFSLLVWLVALQLTVMQPSVVKDWLSNSGIYGKLPQLVVPDASGQDANIFTHQVTQQALSGTFPANYLEEQGNQLIDSTYAWLSGKTTTIQFSIPIDQRKATAINQLQTAIEPIIASLPPCSDNQATQDEQSGNLTCRPADLSATELASTLSSQSVNNSQLLDKPISSQSIKPQDNQLLTALGGLPSYWQQVRTFLIALPIAAVVFGTLAVWLAQDRLLAFGRIGRRLTVGSIMTLLLAAAMIVVGRVMPIPTSGSDASALVIPLLQLVLGDFGQLLAILSGSVCLLGIVIMIIAHMLRRRHAEQDLLQPPTEMPDLDTLPTSKPSTRPTTKSKRTLVGS